MFRGITVLMLITHLFEQKAQNQEQEISAIEFYRISHTNKDGEMTTETKEAYVRILSYLPYFICDQPN